MPRGPAASVKDLLYPAVRHPAPEQVCHAADEDGGGGEALLRVCECVLVERGGEVLGVRRRAPVVSLPVLELRGLLDDVAVHAFVDKRRDAALIREFVNLGAKPRCDAPGVAVGAIVPAAGDGVPCVAAPLNFRLVDVHAGPPSLFPGSAPPARRTAGQRR